MIKQRTEEMYAAPFDSTMPDDDNYFAIGVIGNAMQGAKIMDGDTLIVHIQEEVENNDIAVLYLDDVICVRRYRALSNHEIILSQDNPAYKPEHIRGEEIESRVCILGKVVKICRDIA